MKKKKRLALLLLICIGVVSKAEINQKKRPPQPPYSPGNLPPVIMKKEIANNAIEYSAILRPLIQIPGAQNPFYSCFWEFGDGTFEDLPLSNNRDAINFQEKLSNGSILVKTVHHYKIKNDYQVHLYATNNYDNGRAPLPATLSFRAPSSAKTNEDIVFFGDRDKTRNIEFKLNTNPRQNEELVAYIGYRNLSGKRFRGTIIIFLNETKFKYKMFSPDTIRSFHGEFNYSLNDLLNRMPNYETRKTLGEIKKKYNESVVVYFDSLQKNEQRFLFLPIKTSVNLIADTNAIINMTAVLLSDDPYTKPEIFPMKTAFVTSHDPNRMFLSKNDINLHFIRRKELTYTVQFQNTGEGPSDSIHIGINVPEQLNVSTVKVKELSPGWGCWDSLKYGSNGCVDIIKTADSIYFLFRKIHLPGLKEKNVRNEDSTKGFVTYTIRFRKGLKKIPYTTLSRAVIGFDKNKPDYTNYTNARFTKRWLSGLIVGYNFSLLSRNYNSKGPIQIGYFLSRNSPSGLYVQAEACVGILQKETFIQKSIQPTLPLPSNLLPNNYVIDTIKARVDLTEMNKLNTLQMPFHLGFNIKDWIGLGIGAMIQFEVLKRSKVAEKYFLNGRYYPGPISNGIAFDTLITKTRIPIAGHGTKIFAATNYPLFADIQIGKVKTGTTFGLRYFWQFHNSVKNTFFSYVAFKL